MRVDIEVDKYSGIAGGQFTDEAGTFNEYYIQFEDLNLDMNSETLKNMAVDAINYLMVNGHRFEFGFTEMGQQELRMT